MSLEGNWIEVFRAGDYGERGNWTAGDLDRLAATYDARLHAAPVVLGHPAADAPAYGWVKRLRRAGESLWAQLEKVDPALETLLRAGRFGQRSVALYRQFPLTGGPYLRHLGFLGAATPEVKALAPLRFVAAEFQEIDAGAYPVALNSSFPEEPMPEAKSKLENFVDHLRGFFVPDPPNPTATPPGEGTADPSPAPPPIVHREERGRAGACPPPGTAGHKALPYQPEFQLAERLAALEQRLDAVAGEKTAAERKLNYSEAARQQEQIANFVESLRSRGRFPPMFERWGVREFMERLAQVEGAEKNGGLTERDPAAGAAGLNQDEETARSLLVWFQEFLAKLPAVIEFRELSTSLPHRNTESGQRTPVVRFTEPQRGMSVDPESVELAERAEALAAEANISYAEALAQLREERRSNITSA